MLERIADGRTDLVFELLAQGRPADARDAGGVPLIRWCAYYGDVSAIRHLLSQGERLASLGPNFDLNGAAFHGHWRLCQFLIEQGADADEPLADTEERPLHAALCSLRPTSEPVLEVLLAGGAHPDRATRPAAETGCFMRDVRTCGETPLHRAAAYGSERAIQLLLDAGARLEARDAHGETPLSWASRHLRSDVVLAKLCHGEHSIHPERVRRSIGAVGDHGLGRGPMEAFLVGRPHVGVSSS